MKTFFCVNRQRIILVLAVSSFTGLIFALFTIGNFEQSSYMLLFYRLFYYANDVKTVLPMILTATPYLILLCCLAGAFTDDFAIQTTYCFTRKKNIFNWYFSKVSMLFVFSVFGVSAFFIFGCAVIFVSNDGIPDSETFVSCGKILLSAFLFVFAIALLMNVFSLTVPKKYIFPVAALSILVFASIIPYSVTVGSCKLLFVNPVAHLNALLHCDVLPNEFAENISDIDLFFANMKFFGSCLYFSAVILCSFILGLIIIKYRDIAFNEED